MKYSCAFVFKRNIQLGNPFKGHYLIWASGCYHQNIFFFVKKKETQPRLNSILKIQWEIHFFNCHFFLTKRPTKKFRTIIIYDLKNILLYSFWFEIIKCLQFKILNFLFRDNSNFNTFLTAIWKQNKKNIPSKIIDIKDMYENYS